MLDNNDIIDKWNDEDWNYFVGCPIYFLSIFVL